MTPFSTLFTLWDVAVKDSSSDLWVRVQAAGEGQQWARTPTLPPLASCRPGYRFFFFFNSGYHVALPAGEAKVAAPRAEDSLLCPPSRGGSVVPTPGARLRRAPTDPGKRTPNAAEGVSPAGDRPDAEAREPLTWELWPLPTLAPRRAFGFSLALRTRSHTSTSLPPPR